MTPGMSERPARGRRLGARIAAVVAVGVLAVGCSFQTGLDQAECEYEGTISPDGERRCTNGLWVPFDGRTSPATDAGHDSGRRGEDVVGPAADSEERGDVATDSRSGDADTAETTGGDADVSDGGEVDGCTPQLWYLDDDEDGFGTDETTETACLAPTDYVRKKGDCDDSDENQNPDAEESCNGEDDDCDGRADSQSCYGGAAGTAGVGICSTDRQSCSFGSLETCEATIHRTRPETAERTCDNDTDDDCDGTVDDCLSFETVGSGGNPLVDDLVVDPNTGAVYVTGDAGGVFVAKFDASGSRQWKRELSARGINVSSLAIDPAGSRLAVVGGVESSIGGESVSGSRDGFIALYDLSGQRLDVVTVGSDAADRLLDVSQDPRNGTIVTTGWTSGDWGAVNAGETDAVVVAYQPDLERSWIAQFGSSADDGGEAVEVDATSGEVFVGVDTAGVIVPGETNQGAADLVLARYSSSGDRDWIEQIGSTGDDDVRGLSVAPGSGLYVVGDLEGDIRNTTHVGREDAYLLKYSTGGSFQWLESVGTRVDDYYDDVYYDSAADVLYVVGRSDGRPPGTRGSGRSDVLVGSYGTGGTRRWIELRGTTALDIGLGVGGDSSAGSLYIGGIWNASDGFVERLR